MTNALEALATSAQAGTGFEQVEGAVRDTDVAGFLKKERENEQSRRDAEMAMSLANAVEKDCLCCLEAFSIEKNSWKI